MRALITEAKICENCGTSFNRGRSPAGRIEAIEDWRKRKYCCHKCYAESNKGDRHYNWKGGIRAGHDWGYLRVTDGRYLHRVVMEDHLGRPLERNEHVHHKDGNVLNNDISNLELTTNSAHRALHTKEQKRNERGVFV